MLYLEDRQADEFLRFIGEYYFFSVHSIDQKSKSKSKRYKITQEKVGTTLYSNTINSTTGKYCPEPFTECSYLPVKAITERFKQDRVRF